MFQSIIGATEKRRESGAGVAVIGGIGGLESVGRKTGVYQEWICWVEASPAVISPAAIGKSTGGNGRDSIYAD